MAARLLDGNAVGAAIRDELKPRVAAFHSRVGRPPGLGLILAGHDPASEIYVRNKLKSAGDSGILAELIRVPADGDVHDVLAMVTALNRRDDIDGVLVQSPLPSGMGSDAETRVVETIAPEKDVDGFTAVNVGRLVQNRPGLVPCTPAGVIEMLERAGVPLSGSRAVVLGRSDIVGKPMALLLLHRHATVTICHSRTRDLPAVARTADILVAAIGRPAFVTSDFVKPGAIVVDVGINVVSDESLVRAWFPPDSPRLAAFARRGSLTVGDVHPAVADVAGALTPVPGGVGPLTIAMLLANTVRAAEAVPPDEVPMLKVALTGGIGTGKSVVLACFAELGAPTISADDVAHECLGAATPGAAAVRARFGDDVMRDDGSVDRLRLAAIVFRERESRRDLEAIVHPAVRAAIAAWGDARANDGAPISVAEIPLLFENQRETDFDRVVVTACDEEEQMRRVTARSGLAADDVRRRIAAQMPLAEKIRRAHYVIQTDGSLDLTRQRAFEVWQRLQQAASTLAS